MLNGVWVCAVDFMNTLKLAAVRSGRVHCNSHAERGTHSAYQLHSISSDTSYDIFSSYQTALMRKADAQWLHQKNEYHRKLQSESELSASLELSCTVV